MQKSIKNDVYPDGFNYNLGSCSVNCYSVIYSVMYIDIRKKYIARKYWIRPSMYKFVDFMNSENKNILKNLGIYINKAFIIRNTLLYD
jgi:hypothetical protein